ncbi:hypothetical protein Q3G72_015485 [Acer saccharum]|nr:hypothetical protein Q3G72_015485 [Acer saccharum]
MACSLLCMRIKCHPVQVFKVMFFYSFLSGYGGGFVILLVIKFQNLGSEEVTRSNEYFLVFRNSVLKTSLVLDRLLSFCSNGTEKQEHDVIWDRVCGRQRDIRVTDLDVVHSPLSVKLFLDNV